MTPHFSVDLRMSFTVCFCSVFYKFLVRLPVFNVLCLFSPCKQSVPVHLVIQNPGLSLLDHTVIVFEHGLIVSDVFVIGFTGQHRKEFHYLQQISAPYSLICRR